jgi:hypothetical protein
LEVALSVPKSRFAANNLRWEVKHGLSKKGRKPLSAQQVAQKKTQLRAYEQSKLRASVGRIEEKVNELPTATATAVTSAMASADNELGVTPTEQIAIDRLKVRFLNNRINKNRELQKEVARAKHLALAEAKVKAAATKAATSADSGKKARSPKRKSTTVGPAEEVQPTPKKKAKKTAAPEVEVEQSRKVNEEGREDEVVTVAEAFKCPMCKFVARSGRGLKTHQTRQGHFSEEDQQEEEEEEAAELEESLDD